MAGSILDVIGNPFQRAAGGGSAPAGTDANYFPPAPSAPAPMSATSRVIQNYNPLRDPEGPLARAGWIGSLFATGPSKTEYLYSIEQQKEQEIGQARGAAFQKLATLVDQGLTPQKAFLQFMNTPEGVDFIVKDPDPTAAVSQFMKMAQGDPTAMARAGVFGGLSSPAMQNNPGQVTPGVGGEAAKAAVAAVQPQAGQGALLSGQPMAQNPSLGMEAPGGIQPAVPGPQTGAPAAAPVSQAPVVLKHEGQDVALPAGVDGNRLRAGASELAAVGDMEGARIALELAKQYDEVTQPQTTDELKEYAKDTAERAAKGLPERGWFEYKTSISKSGAQTTNVDVNTEPGMEAAKTKARLEVDIDASKKASEAALKAAQAIPVLEEIERIGAKTKGGFAGSLAPYLGRIATSFGMTVDPAWSDAEQLSALTMQLIPLVRQPGAVSDYEQKTYAQAVPSLAQTPEGRMKILSVMKRQAERAQEIARVYRDNIGEKDLYDKLAALDKPMFTPDELREFGASEEVTGPPKPVAGAADQGPIIPKGTVQAGENGMQYRSKGGYQFDKNNWELITKDKPAPTVKQNAPVAPTRRNGRSYN